MSKTIDILGALGLILAFVSCESVFLGEDLIDSGIDGTVLRGPMCPVVSLEQPCPDQPFAALFHVFNEQGSEVATFESDELGHFRLSLTAGTYLVVPDESAPLLQPKQQGHEVVVPYNRFAEITLLFDTGIR